MGWLADRRRRKRDKETPEQALKRIMRAEIVINLGAGALLIPAEPNSPKIDTAKAIKQMIQVAKGDSSF